MADHNPILLTKDEERSLVKRAKDGDREAWNDLFKKFHPFIKKRIMNYSRKFALDIEDLEQEAFFCIILASHRFDLRRKTRFSTLLSKTMEAWFSRLSRQEQHVRLSRSWFEADIRWMYKKGKENRQIYIPWEPAALDWPEEARRFAKRFARRSDRLIAKWLWMDCPPLPQAEIARRLGVSRSAVTQRRHKLEKILFLRFGRMSFVPKYLDKFHLTAEDDDVYVGR